MPSNTKTNVVSALPQALFDPGEFQATPGVLSFLSKRLLTVVPLYDQHLIGDWTEMSELDQAANRDAVKNGGCIRSRYVVDEQPIWVITEADRSTTTILLPCEH